LLWSVAMVFLLPQVSHLLLVVFPPEVQQLINQILR
jgi:hypothetical protein